MAEPGTHLRVGGGVKRREREEVARRGGGDLAEHLRVVESGHVREALGRFVRVGQVVRPHTQHVDQGRHLERPARGVQHRRAGREPGHHGQALALAQVRVHHAGRPFDLPVARDPAQREVPLIGPYSSGFREID